MGVIVRTTACINEIFSSLQGEGPYTGEKMVFIRLASCPLNCVWCDTAKDEQSECNVYEPYSDDIKKVVQNPIGIAALNDILQDYPEKFVSITGGEPLEQADFLAEFLPTITQTRKILLETNGTNFEALKKIEHYVDIISADIKLPSSSGNLPLWKQHKSFLETAVASGKEVYVKIVVTGETTDKDINEAIRIISAIKRNIQIILQPVTPNEAFEHTISDDRLNSIQRLFSAWLPNVSVMKQMHTEWGIK